MTFYKLGLVLFFTIGGLNGAHAGRNSSALKCLQLMDGQLAQRTDEPFYLRGKPLPPVNFHDTRSFLAEQQRGDVMARVVERFSVKHDTSFYFPITQAPDSHGVYPMVDSNSPAVFIFLHGGGTSKGSGKNFFAQINTLADMGISSFGMDLPFHASGPLNENFYDLEGRFFPWLDKIVDEAASYGKPVIFVTHSWGTNIAYSYRKRYGKVGVLAMSWVLRTPESDKWRKFVMPRMKFFKDLLRNPSAGQYVNYFVGQTTVSDKTLPDPTESHPELPFHVLVGAMEEFYPTPIEGKKQNPVGPSTFPMEKEFRKRAKNAKIVIEPGVGHGLFHFKDEAGHDVVLREILDMIGLDVANEGIMKTEMGRIKQKYPSYEQAAIRYGYDRLFKAWADEFYGEGKVLVWLQQKDSFMAERSFKEYDFALQRRLEEIYEEIRQTKITRPDFYANNKKAVDDLQGGKRSNAALHAYLLQVLKGNIDSGD